ncbi:hypothetical protein K488DRAFT_92718 [Vararia minispora EC-137]|uniref:Uncharacterized protein n=1 Tax=Vararia minispora EC-137 TaxID=1314806 RepID=A0ACB8Q3S2_9AGAM|nr:hypothetical protein K488DRAFT_92718 [Vararia minispora EC-137]
MERRRLAMWTVGVPVPANTQATLRLPEVVNYSGLPAHPFLLLQQFSFADGEDDPIDDMNDSLLEQVDAYCQAVQTGEIQHHDRLQDAVEGVSSPGDDPAPVEYRDQSSGARRTGVERPSLTRERRGTTPNSVPDGNFSRLSVVPDELPQSVEINWESSQDTPAQPVVQNDLAPTLDKNCKQIRDLAPHCVSWFTTESDSPRSWPPPIDKSQSLDIADLFLHWYPSDAHRNRKVVQIWIVVEKDVGKCWKQVWEPPISHPYLHDRFLAFHKDGEKPTWLKQNSYRRCRNQPVIVGPVIGSRAS